MITPRLACAVAVLALIGWAGGWLLWSLGLDPGDAPTIQAVTVGLLVLIAAQQERQRGRGRHGAS